MGFIDNIKTYCSGSRALAWLLVITVVSGIVCWGTGLIVRLAGAGHDPINSWLALPSGLIVFLTHPWTILTYMVVHFSPLHLIFNALWLYWFGRMLADTRDDRTILTLFIGGGVAGGVLYLLISLLSSYDTGFLTGDSAAVLSLMTGAAILMPQRRIGLFLLGEVRLKWVAIGCILITLLGGGGGLQSQAAHLGGAAFGAITAICLKNGINFSWPKSDRNKKRGINTRATVKAFSSLSDHDRLDQLLDKIRISGYESLSAKEKAELNYISSRIDNGSSSSK